MRERTAELEHKIRVLARVTDLVGESKADVHLSEAWPVAFGHGAWVEEVRVNYLSNAFKVGGRPPCVDLGAAEDSDHDPGATKKERPDPVAPSR